MPSLGELTARCVASHIPFELVEHVYPPVPEQLQLRIAFWSFPDNEEDIRLYSCLANGSADEFQRGEHLFKNRAVKDPLQIGKCFIIILKSVLCDSKTQTTANIRAIVLCYVCLCSLIWRYCHFGEPAFAVTRVEVFQLEDGDNRFLQNVGRFQTDCIASHPIMMKCN